MCRQEPLSLPHTFKSTHDPLSNSRRLMGKFCSVISILTCIVNRIRDEVSNLPEAPVPLVSNLDGQGLQAQRARIHELVGIERPFDRPQQRHFETVSIFAVWVGFSDLKMHCSEFPKQLNRCVL